MIKTGLVARDTRRDVIGFASHRFAHKLCIRQERARHRNHVCRARADDILGNLRRVDAVGGDDRDAHLAHQLFRDPREGSARNGCRNRWNTCFVPADTRVDNRRACLFDSLGKGDDFIKGRSIRDKVDHRQTIDNDKIGADGFTHTAHDFDR